MGQRSKVETDLPADKRSELDRKLIDGRFSGYVQLESWLAKEGFQIGKSSLQRYGSRMEERLAELKAATDEAKAYVAAAPDDADAMSRATMQMLQSRLFGLLRDMDYIDPESVDITKVAKAMAPLVRASIAQQEYMRTVRDRLAKQVDELAQAQGMGPEQRDHWMNKFLGVAQAT